MIKEVKIKTRDNFILSGILSTVDKPKGLVQLIHGAAEHKGRYSDLIEMLNKNGYNCIITDNRGHGKSVDKNYPLGTIKDYNDIVEDQYEVSKYFKNLYPGYSLTLFGHSLGSMFSRLYLKKYDEEIDKLILCGTVAYNPSTSFGIFLGSLISIFKGKNGYSNLLHKLVLNKEDDSWICSNKEIIALYHKDKLCQYNYPIGSLNEIIRMNREMNKTDGYQLQNKNLKILSITGEEDPITGGEKGLKKSRDKLLKIGYKNIKFITYPHMKHEVFHEINKEVVYKDIIDFLNK